MKIGILGSGMVGKTLGARLAGLGQDVVVGTRSPDNLREWAESVGARAGSCAETASFAEILFNATRGDLSLAALKMAGEANLNGKILVDIANPLDFSGGMLPTLTVSNTDSLGEQLQREFPQARFVKALNTLNAALMVDPESLAGGDHTVFVCGNDSDAKRLVTGLLESFGWRDVIDLGDITGARGTEMLLPIWLRLMNVLGTPRFNFKIVR